MVTTVTLNPALDYVLHLPAFVPGAVNRAADACVQAGGKGINVSAVLHALGEETRALGFTAGFTGQEIERQLREQGVPAQFLHLKTGMSRINVKLKAGAESEVNGPGPAVPPAAVEQLLRQLEALPDGETLVLAGSIPPPLPQTLYGQILARLAGRQIDAVVDAEGALLAQTLAYHPFLVKPNRAELAAFLGRAVDSEAALEDGAAQLQRQGARNVLVSLAGDGALLLDETKQYRRLAAPRGKVCNSVGAGDSMVAGFLAGWRRTGDYAQALRLGVATGSATAFSEGLAGRGAIEQVFAKL